MNILDDNLIADPPLGVGGVQLPYNKHLLNPAVVATNPQRPGTSCSEEIEEFCDELQFDPTVSSGFFGGLGQGGFRSVPTFLTLKS